VLEAVEDAGAPLPPGSVGVRAGFVGDLVIPQQLLIDAVDALLAGDLLPRHELLFAYGFFGSALRGRAPGRAGARRVQGGCKTGEDDAPKTTTQRGREESMFLSLETLPRHGSLPRHG